MTDASNTFAAERADGASLQDTWAPNNRCFGCGPANEHGLRIKSFVDGERLVANWRPQSHHEAFSGMLNGGICGALLDCHMNWAAAHHLMVARDEPTPPCTVTASFEVRLLQPTPTDCELELLAWVVDRDGSKVRVEGELRARGEVTVRGSGLFVAVREGHPAYHRW